MVSLCKSTSHSRSSRVGGMEPDRTCGQCGKHFKHKRSVDRHVREVHSVQKVSCPTCGKVFKTRRFLTVHLKVHQSASLKKRDFKCRRCGFQSVSIIRYLAHKRDAHPRQYKYPCNACWRRFETRRAQFQHVHACRDQRRKKEKYAAQRETIVRSASIEPQWTTQTAVGGYARVHQLAIVDEYDLQLSLIENKTHVVKLLQSDMKDLKRIKWYMAAHIVVQNDDEAQGNNIRYMRCRPISTLIVDDLEEHVREAILGVTNDFDHATDEGSRMIFERVETLEIRVGKLSLLHGSSYLPLPDWLQRSSKGLVNIKNENDEKCFAYCVLAGIKLPAHNPQRASHYVKRMSEINMKGVKYPVSVKDVSKFESNNKNIAVSVFGLEKKQVIPMRVSREIHRRHRIKLLLLQDEDSVDTHYVLIKNLSRFLAHLSKRGHALIWCDNCLTPRSGILAHKVHWERCAQFESQAVQMPVGRKTEMKFSDHDKKVIHDFVIYADIECRMESYSTAYNNPKISTTANVSKHIPCGFCYVIVGPDRKMVKEPVLVHGENNIIESLLLHLQKESVEIMQKRGENYKLSMTEKTEKLFSEATHCYVCKDSFSKKGIIKCRDHAHTKKFDNYNGAACQSCNLNMKRRDFIPVFFHNLSGYDGHLILSEIGRLSDGSDMTAIAKNKLKYISFSWGHLRFLDSFNFLSSSLEKLVQDLTPQDLKMLTLIFPNVYDRQLVSRKGVYCYNYFDSVDKFLETHLPPKEAFKNDLSGENVSDDDYHHAQTVFSHFKLQNLWEYHDLYLLTDVLLLCDVMETFRSVELTNMGLDIVHYYTTPGYSWSAALLFTGEKLELLEDYCAHICFENCLRGGVATINTRMAEANNPFVPNYDPKKPHSWLLYLDANNLYGKALSGPLPYANFRFLSQQEINEIDVKKIADSDEEGYVFEIDLAYPESLHDAHNDFCLAPEHMTPTYENLSELQKTWIKKWDLSKKSTQKLIPNLYDKYKYTVYGSTLRLYVELGLVITKIHRVMAFSQKPWLAPYINYNTRLRQLATSDFQKNLLKLKNNSIFGKSCEQVKKRRSVSFTREQSKFVKLVRSPLFHSFEILDHDMIIIERRKPTIVLNRPIYVGAVVLDVSKQIMFNFHYNAIKKMYNNKVTMCASDTDSLFYHIETHNVYEDMQKMSEWFDTSDYPQDHPLYSLKNKKVMGLFKDENNGKIMTSFIGLRAKMYTYSTLDGKSKCVGKGIPRPALKQQLSFKDYYKCLVEKKIKNVNFKKISSDRKHHLYTTFSTKRGLSCYDDKRYIEHCNVNTKAYGHYSIRDEGEKNLLELVQLLDDM